jgi:hypothetical protein
MPSPVSSNTASDPEILAARGKVELAKAELENRLYQVGDSGRVALGRMARKAAPLLVVAGILVGTVVAVRLLAAASKRRRAIRLRVDEPAGPSLARVVFGAVLRGFVRVAATRIAEQAAARLVAAREESELEPEPSSAAAR